MKDLNLKLANASILVVINSLDTNSGTADASFELAFNEGGSAYEDIEELTDGDELVEWIEENGGEFAFELQSEKLSSTVNEVLVGTCSSFQDASFKWTCNHWSELRDALRNK